MELLYEDEDECSAGPQNASGAGGAEDPAWETGVTCRLYRSVVGGPAGPSETSGSNPAIPEFPCAKMALRLGAILIEQGCQTESQEGQVSAGFCGFLSISCQLRPAHQGVSIL